MAAASDSCKYELRILRAAEDGVEPAVLLKAPGRRAEYLFNVPDGFSRLALEHKLTPSARLSCVLLTSLLPESIGGLGGLMLRLKQDGHGQVQVVGPRGSAQVVHSLRHICRWRHPRVIVSECRDDRPAPVFSDEYIAIVPLLAGDQSVGCPWCVHASVEPPSPTHLAEKFSGPVSKHGEDSSSSSSHCCSSSSSGCSDSPSRDDGAMKRFLQSASDGVEEIFEKSLGMFSSSSQRGSGGQCEFVPDSAASPNSQFSFDSSATHVAGSIQQSADELYTSPDAGSELTNRHKDARRISVLRSLKESSGVLEGDFSERKRVKVTPLLGNAPSSSFQGNGGHHCNLHSSSVGGIEAAAYVEGEGKLDNPEPPANGAKGDVGIPVGNDAGFVPTSENCMIGRGDMLARPTVDTSSLNVNVLKPFEWEISNLDQFELPQLADEANPVFECTPSGKLESISSLEVAGHAEVSHADNPTSCSRPPGVVLGYICFLRKLNEAVLFAACSSVKHLESLRTHPALGCVYHLSREGYSEARSKATKGTHIIGSVVHLTPHNVMQSSEYQSWMNSFACPVHVIVNDSFTEFGFQSSLATLKKLNGVHPSIFPLPKHFQSNQAKDLPEKILNRSSMSFVRARLCTGVILNPEGCSVSGAPANVVETSRSTGEAADRTVDSILTSVSGQNLRGVAASPLSSDAKNGPGVSCCGLVRSGATEMRGSYMSNSEPPNAAAKSSRDEGGSRACSLLMNAMGVNDDPGTFLEDTGSAFHVQSRVDRRMAMAPANEPEAAGTPPVILRSPVSITKPRGSALENEEARLHHPDSDFQLSFLGTGCAEPSKKRSSSGILLQVRDAHGCILLDAGEGTVGQLCRRFGETGALDIISSLQALWLSHKHGDHVLGTLSVLHKRSIGASSSYIIFGPERVCQWLSEVTRVWIFNGYSVAPFQFIHCGELSDCENGRAQRYPNSKLLLDLLDAMQLQSIRSVRVNHCYDAYGIVLKGKLGWSVVYSGDTRPCRQLIESGHGCSLLIHEATFEDSLIDQARQKRHSTVSEALQVGLQMRASHIILTHFSQRYPEMVAISAQLCQNVSLAFDGMVVPSGLLGSLGALLPSIRVALQKATDVLKAVDTDGRVFTKPILATRVTHTETRNLPLSAVTATDSGKSVVTQHKRWLSESDEDENLISSSIRWSSDSEEEAKNQTIAGPIFTTSSKGFTYDTGSNVCERGIKNFFGSTPLEGDELIAKNRVCNENESNSRSEVTETYGPFGSKHLRWNDSDSGSGSDS